MQCRTSQCAKNACVTDALNCEPPSLESSTGILVTQNQFRKCVTRPSVLDLFNEKISTHPDGWSATMRNWLSWLSK